MSGYRESVQIVAAISQHAVFSSRERLETAHYDAELAEPAARNSALICRGQTQVEWHA